MNDEASETVQEAPKQWAIIELMGHVRYGGIVSKDTQFGTAMLRVDVPQPDGSFVSQLVNPSSIYRVTMSDEALARAAAKHGDSKPLESWQVKHLLPKEQQDGLQEALNYAGDDDSEPEQEEQDRY